MSHFTEVKTKIKDTELLKESLSQLNLTYEHDANGVAVRGFVGDTVQCEFKIDTGTKYDIGLRMTDEGVYEFIADWDMLEKTNAASTRDKLMQKYSHLKVRKSLETQGYEIEEEVNEQGEIQMKVHRWA